MTREGEALAQTRSQFSPLLFIAPAFMPVEPVKFSQSLQLAPFTGLLDFKGLSRTARSLVNEAPKFERLVAYPHRKRWGYE